MLICGTKHVSLYWIVYEIQNADDNECQPIYLCEYNDVYINEIVIPLIYLSLVMYPNVHGSAREYTTISDLWYMCVFDLGRTLWLSSIVKYIFVFPYHECYSTMCTAMHSFMQSY